MNLVREWVAARVKINEHDCWLWQSGKTKDGYGRCGFLGSIYLSHRLVKHLYEQASLEDLRDSEVVFSHKCDVPACVNPWHIELVTQLENIKDRENKGRGRKGVQVWSARLNETLVKQLGKARRKIQYFTF